MILSHPSRATQCRLLTRVTLWPLLKTRSSFTNPIISKAPSKLERNRQIWIWLLKNNRGQSLTKEMLPRREIQGLQLFYRSKTTCGSMFCLTRKWMCWCQPSTTQEPSSKSKRTNSRTPTSTTKARRCFTNSSHLSNCQSPETSPKTQLVLLRSRRRLTKLQEENSSWTKPPDKWSFQTQFSATKGGPTKWA